jgi:hypothetical protein
MTAEVETKEQEVEPRIQWRLTPRDFAQGRTPPTLLKMVSKRRSVRQEPSA